MKLQGKYRECEPMAREAVRIVEKVVETENPLFALALRVLGRALLGQVL